MVGIRSQALQTLGAYQLKPGSLKRSNLKLSMTGVYQLEIAADKRNEIDAPRFNVSTRMTQLVDPF